MRTANLFQNIINAQKLIEYYKKKRKRYDNKIKVLEKQLRKLKRGNK